VRLESEIAKEAEKERETRERWETREGENRIEKYGFV